MIPGFCTIALGALLLLDIAQVGASRFALAAVDDPRGKPLVDVGADDFVVQEGAASREILDVRVADYPIVLLIDNSVSARADLPTLRTAAAHFVERLGPRPVAVITVGGPPTTVASFEDDRATIGERIENLSPAADECQPLRGAAAAGQLIQSTGALFSAIVLVTASTEEVEGPAADALIAPVIDSRAVLHVVFNGAASKRGIRTAALMRGVAAQTHGQFTPVYAAVSYQPALDHLAARLTTELLIEYLVPVGSKAVDVKVGVKIPGARVRGLGVAPR